MEIWIQRITMFVWNWCDCTMAMDYRLAPEHAYPAGPNDAVTASRRFKGSNGKFLRVIVQETISCLEATDKDKICGAVVVYPMVEYYDSGFMPLQECATGYALTTDVQQFLVDSFLGPNFDTKSQDAS